MSDALMEESNACRPPCTTLVESNNSLRSVSGFSNSSPKAFSQVRQNNNTCKKVSLTVQTDANNNVKNRRDFRLLKRWVDEASPVLSVYCRYATPCTEKFDPTKHSFLIKVDFDYNQKNFRPVQNAEIVNADNDCANGEEVKLVVSAKIKYKDLELSVPIFLDATDSKGSSDSESMDEYGEQNLRHQLFNAIQLESSVFKKWARLEKENRHKSYSHFLSNEVFGQFMIQAFHLTRSRPLHNPESCVMTLGVTFGFGLGQIETLENFFVLPKKHVLKNLQEWYNLKPKVVNRLEKQCTVKHCSEMVNIAVILLAHASRKIFVHHFAVPWSMIPSQRTLPRKCDQRAKELFEELRQKPALSFDSPDLNA